MKILVLVVLKLVLYSLLLVFGCAALYWLVGINSIRETSKPNYLRQIEDRYSDYVEIDEVKRLSWATGMWTGCTYTLVRWSGDSSFKLSGIKNENGEWGIQLGYKKVWFPHGGEWDRGPIIKRRPTANWKEEVSNCNTTKFGRVSNAYKKIFTEDVWFVDTTATLLVVSNEDRTIEYLSHGD